MSEDSTVIGEALNVVKDLGCCYIPCDALAVWDIYYGHLPHESTQGCSEHASMLLDDDVKEATLWRIARD